MFVPKCIISILSILIFLMIMMTTFIRTQSIHYMRRDMLSTLFTRYHFIYREGKCQFGNKDFFYLGKKSKIGQTFFTLGKKVKQAQKRLRKNCHKYIKLRMYWFKKLLFYPQTSDIYSWTTIFPRKLGKISVVLE